MSAGSQPGKGAAQTGTGKSSPNEAENGKPAGQNGAGPSAEPKSTPPAAKGPGTGEPPKPSTPGAAKRPAPPPSPGDRSVASSPPKPAGSDRPAQSGRESGQNSSVQKGAVPGGPPVSKPGSPSRPSEPRSAGAGGVPGSGPQRTTPRPPPPPMPAASSLVPKESPQKSKSEGKGSKRRAHLVLSRVEPWSVTKFSFVISLVAFIVLFVAVAVLYGILAALGVFDSLTQTLRDLTTSGDGQSTFDPASWFSASRVLGYTGLIGALNVVLITALSTVGAVLYNLAADLVGGVEVTLSEGE